MGPGPMGCAYRLPPRLVITYVKSHPGHGCYIMNVKRALEEHELVLWSNFLLDAGLS